MAFMFIISRLSANDPSICEVEVFWGETIRDACAYLGQGARLLLRAHLCIYICSSTGVDFGL